MKLKMFRRSLEEYSVTCSVLTLIAVVYVGQLALAENLASGAAYTVATSLSTRMYLALTPWLHSNHQHVLQNALVFAILGVWTERRVNSSSYLAIILLAGYLTNLAPYTFGFGGLGIGASGITNLLWANFTAVQFGGYVDVLKSDTLDISRAMIHAVVGVLGFLFVLNAVAEFVGYTEPAPGTATGAHLLGVILGFTWVVYRVVRSRKGAEFEMGLI